MTEALRKILIESDNRKGPMIYDELKRFCKIVHFIQNPMIQRIPEDIIISLNTLSDKTWEKLLKIYQDETTAKVQMINGKSLPEVRVAIQKSLEE